MLNARQKGKYMKIKNTPSYADNDLDLSTSNDNSEVIVDNTLSKLQTRPAKN